jgi:hypothetical protein
MSGTEGMMIGSLITSGSALIGVILAKCRCIYKRDSEGNCSPACGFSDKPLNDHHEIDIIEQQVDDVPVIIITKKT